MCMFWQSPHSHNIWVRYFSKSAHGFCVSDCAMCTFSKSPHSHDTMSFGLLPTTFPVKTSLVDTETMCRRSNVIHLQFYHPHSNHLPSTLSLYAGYRFLACYSPNGHTTRDRLTTAGRMLSGDLEMDTFTSTQRIYMQPCAFLRRTTVRPQCGCCRQNCHVTIGYPTSPKSEF